MSKWIEFTVRIPFHGRILVEEDIDMKELMEKIEQVVQIRAKSHALNFNHAEFKIKELESIPLKAS